jgi:hypothetical protein
MGEFLSSMVGDSGHVQAQVMTGRRATQASELSLQEFTQVSAESADNDSVIATFVGYGTRVRLTASQSKQNSTIEGFLEHERRVQKGGWRC